MVTKPHVNYFVVSDYLFRAAQTLVLFQGICSKSPARKKKTLSSEIRNIITNFYCDNENTKIMPGTHDQVSIASSVNEQKNFVKCMLFIYQSHVS